MPSEQRVEHDVFSPIRVTPEPVTPLSARDARAGWRTFRAEGGFEAAVPEHVIERALIAGRRADPVEWYGLLVGRLHEHGGFRHVTVEGFVPDDAAIATGCTVATTPESEFRTRELSRRLYPDAVIVGWIHGHRRHGVRFSSTDRKTQATWRQPHSLGIVVDPWDPSELSVYRGPGAELLVPVLAKVEHQAAVAAVLAPEVMTAPAAAMPKRKRVRRLVRHARRYSGVVALGLVAALVAIPMNLVRRVDALESLASRPGQPAVTVPPPHRSERRPPALACIEEDEAALVCTAAAPDGGAD